MKPFMAAHYEYVAIDVGRFNKNLQIPARWGLGKLEKGVPTIIIADADGKAVNISNAADLESAEAVGRRAGERAVKRLNPRKAETQAVPVFYDPRVASSLIGHFAGAVSGAAIARGVSFLKDRMGDHVFSDGVTIVDDPHRKRGLRSKPFDGEGVANRRTVLVDAGRLTTWLLDSASARQLGLTTTGHAARGTGGPPSPSTTNLYMMPGPLSPAALMADVREGIYVTELIGILRPECVARVEPHDNFLRVVPIIQHDRPTLAASDDERL